MRAGLHLSLRNGLVSAVETAQRFGCETLQLFTRPLHLGLAERFSDEEVALFATARRDAGLAPLILHTPYLPNLSSTHPRIADRSRRALRDDLEACRRLDADFYVIHPGAHPPNESPLQGLARMAEALNEGLAIGGRTRVLFENMAGGSRRLGSTWEELADLIRRVKDSRRIGVCLDTAHTLGAGHAFSTAAEVDGTLRSFDRLIGLDRLFVIHANGSRAERGSHRDWHTHLDEGWIRPDAFQALFQHPRLASCAVILETPRDRPDADARNLALLRTWLP